MNKVLQCREPSSAPRGVVYPFGFHGEVTLGSVLKELNRIQLGGKY